MKLALAVVVSGWLMLAGVSPASADAGAPVPSPSLQPGISVAGSRLLKNGSPWIPRGVQIVGLVAPDGALNGKYVPASQHFSAGELGQAVADGADVVRFQVSQFGLDPNSRLYSTDYLTEIENAVASARSLGLAVIISVQAEPPAGENIRCPLPDPGTELVWAELAPLFADDPSVMFELYNEPAIAATSGGWQVWLDGGPVSERNGSSCDSVGMQALINEIRALGARNTIIVPAPSGEQTLAGLTAPEDPADPADPQLAYGIHYPPPSGGIALWNRRFGSTAATKPVIVTEWDNNATTNCLPDAPTLVPSLLAYLATKQIGIVGFAFDIPGTIVADWTYAPTTYAGFTCGIAGGGPGQLLFNEFAGLAQAENPAAADGTAPASNPTAWILRATTLSALERAAPDTTPYLFNTSRTFVTGATPAELQALGAPAAIPTAAFTSETALAAAVRDGTLPAGTLAVLLDDANSQLTPRAEQLHPSTYYRRAATIAHTAHLLLIAAPATDLVTSRAPHTPHGRELAKFLQLGIAAAAARYADVYVIGPQDAEIDEPQYARFVNAAGRQAISAHPGIELIAGLSALQNGHRPSASALDGVIAGTETTVDGYRLDDPGPSTSCPHCTSWSVRLGAALLKQLGGAP